MKNDYYPFLSSYRLQSIYFLSLPQFTVANQKGNLSDYIY